MRNRMLVLLTCVALVAQTPSPSPTDPQAASLVRKLFEQSQAGKIDPSLLAPSARAALTPALQRGSWKGPE